MMVLTVKRRFGVVLTVMGLVSFGLRGPTPAAAVAADPGVAAITAGLAQLAAFTNLKSGGLASAGSFATPVSQLTVTPGEPSTLGFDDLLDKLIVNRIPAGSSQLSDVATALSTGASGVDLEGGGRHAFVTATPTPAPTGTTTEQLQLDFTVTRSVDSGLQIASTSPSLQVNASHGVKADFTLTGTMTVAFDSSRSFFYLVHTASTPSLKVDLAASIPDVTKVDVAIGILAMKLITSTFQLNTHYVTTWLDSNNDGKLAFTEPASGGATNPGELAQAANTAAIVTAGYAPSSTAASSVSGQLDLDTAPSAIPGLTLPSIPTSVSVTSADLSTVPPTVTTPSLDARLVKFNTLGPRDLATSVARLLFLVRDAQLAHLSGAQHGDASLPFLDAKLSDAVRPDELFVKFLTDPANVDQATGQAKFSSIQGFFNALSQETVNVPSTGPAVVTATVANASYDDPTSRLAFEIVVNRTGGTENINDPTHGSTDKNLGTVQIGNATQSLTGIRNAADPGGDVATTAPTYTLHLPVVLDLKPPVAGTACATANDPANPANAACPFSVQEVNGSQVIGTKIISSLPIAPDRFLVATGGTLLDADTTVSATVTAAKPSVGMAGFVQAGFDTGSISIATATGAAHLVHIGLASQGPQRMGVLMNQLNGGTPSTAISYDTLANFRSTLHGFVPDASLFFDGADPTLTASSDDITQPALTIAGAGLQDRLKPLDFGADSTALRGAVANEVGALRDTLQKLGTLTTGATKDRLNAKVQVLGRSMSSLLRTTELDAALSAISSNSTGTDQGPSESLQGLIHSVSTALGTPSVLAFHMDGSHPASHLVLDVDYVRLLDSEPAAPLAMRFQSAGKPLDLVGVGTDGTLSAKGRTEAHLALTVPLDGTAPTDPSQVMVQGNGSVSVSPDLSFSGSRTATVGALAVTLNPAKIEAHPRLTVQGPGGGLVSLATWASGASSAAPAADPTVTCPDGSIGKAVCADLKTLGSSFGVSLSGDEAFFGDGLAGITPDNSSITVPGSLTTAQSSLTLDLPKIKDGLNGGLAPYLDDISRSLDVASANGKLPFVGKDIQEGSAFVQKLKQDLTAAVGALSVTATTPTSNDVENALNTLHLTELSGFTATVTCGGISCLGTEDASAVDGVRFSMTVGQGSVTPGTACSGSNCPSVAPGKLDLGIPGVRFRSDASPAIDLGWQLKLTFGFDKEHGFYLDAGSPANNDLKLALSLNLPDFDAQIGFVTVKAADMNGGGGTATADTNHSTPEFSGTFEIGLQQVNGKSLLSISDIASADIAQLVHIGLGAKANVQYDLSANAGSDFPGISAHLGVTWGWDSTHSDPTDNTGLAIGFSDVKLELDPFFHKLLGPVYDDIKKTISPLKPVVDAIDGPIPGVSDISHMVGGGDISILTLMKLYSTFNGGNGQFAALERVLRLVQSAVDFGSGGTVHLGDFGVNKDKALVGIPTPDQIQNFITGNALAGAKAVQDAVTAACAKCGDALNKLTKEIGLDELDPTGTIGLHLPVLDQPEKLAGLLLGQDISLVTYDTGPLHNEFSFAITIGPLGIPLFIDIGVAATVDMRFSGGFDTYGIRKAIETGKLASILDGFYLDDFDSQGQERPEIAISHAMVYIDAKLSLAVVEAGIRGAINLTANLDLKDSDSPKTPDLPNTGKGDGKVRINELGRDANGDFNAFCIFDSSGDISADLVLFFKVNFGLFDEEWTNTLAHGQILNLDHSCDAPAPPPTLGQVAGTDLIINAGKYGTGTARGNAHWDNKAGGPLTKTPNPALDGAETQPTELTTVRAQHDAAGNFLGFGVDLLGNHQDFMIAPNPGIPNDPGHPGLNRVILDATGYDGREIVNMLGDGTGTDPAATGTTVRHFDQPAVILGGNQDDQIKVDGRAPAGSSVAPVVAVDGGQGNDLIITGDGNDLIAGGPGNDDIHSGAGNDQVAGDAALTVGPNYAVSLDALHVTEINGGANADGNDTIDAGLGGGGVNGSDVNAGDVVNGGGGNDHIAGGADDGRVVTDPTNPAFRDDNNVLIGGSGNDSIVGGPHHDTIYGDYYETLTDPAATGTMVAGLTYDDHIDSGTGDNTVYGGAGADTIVGHSVSADATQTPPVIATHDTFYGNGGADTITGGAGDDSISGGPDNDTILGGPANDTIHGDAGDDNIGGDSSLTPANPALGRFSQLQPSSQQDGNDIIFGGAGNDTIYGGGGDDLIFGDQGNATCPVLTSTNPVVWPAASEPVTAGDGNDTINGGPGNDIISGEGGNDTITGGAGNDRICGHQGNDVLSGGTGDDLISGGSGNDQLYGDDGNDHLEGNSGADVLSGGPGNDQLIGGTSVAGSADTGDTIYGDAGDDVIIGDNGTIRNASPPVVNVFDLTSTDPTLGGNDTIDAGSGNDTAFGGLGDDTTRGGDGDDHLEGNVGTDTIYGGAGQDDIIGGTSPVAVAGADSSAIPDVGDHLYGEDGNDVVVGDNGSITRDNPVVLDGSDPTDTPMVHRTLALLGIYTGGPIVGGDDVMSGGNNNDWLLGGVGNDAISGDGGNDHIEGDNGSDTLSGGDGQDDVIGGTSPLALAPGHTTTDVTDVGDAAINGDAGADYLIGDNGSITHPLDAEGNWAISQADGSFLRSALLLDRLTVGGADTMSGGDGNDRMWGGIGNDTMDGGVGDDYMEGNLGSDIMSGGAGDDDIVGGTSPVALPAGSDASAEADGTAGAAAGTPRLGNHICGFECSQTTGQPDNDVIAGNNARIDRCAPVNGAAAGRDGCAWTQTSYGRSKDATTSLGTSTTRYPTLLGESSSETTHNGDDYIEGNSGNDAHYGEDGNDVLHGDTPAANAPRSISAWSALPAPSPDECLPVSDPNAGQDIAIGGYGNDLACGEGGDDALIGDRATVTVTPFTGATQNISSAGPPNLVASFPASGDTIYPTTLLDFTVGGNDLLFGGPGNDTIHGGAGDDFIQGDDGMRIAGQTAATGDDILFGDNGNDSIQGGPGNDHLWGGDGNDDLDVIRSPLSTDVPPKSDEHNKALPPLFPNIPAYATRFPAPAGQSYDIDPGAQNNPTTTNGDIAYGGYNRDISQADNLNDRLVDSFGAYNLFMVCPAAYGGSQITRSLSPGVLTYLQKLGQADGAVGAADRTSVGGGEVTIIYPGTANPNNAGAAYSTTPGHFTC